MGAHEAIAAEEVVGGEAAVVVVVDTREIDSPEAEEGRLQATGGPGKLFSTWGNTWIKPSW